MRHIPRPEVGEYAPYVTEYHDLVPGDGVLDHMHACLDTTPAFFRSVPEAVLVAPHRQGEWTVKQIVQHIADDERIYAYRTLRFARGDTTDLPGFDQDAVAALSGADARSLDSLLDEYVTVRRSTLSLFEGLPAESLTRVGIADGNPMSVRAAAFHIAGHELHHIESVRENYLR